MEIQNTQDGITYKGQTIIHEGKVVQHGYGTQVWIDETEYTGQWKYGQ